MADIELTERELLEKKWKSLLEKHWVAKGESVLQVDASVQGYVGSVVNQRLAVPHTPLSEVRKTVIEAPDWPLPSEQVSSGAFMADEWADDPSIMWWVFADDASRDAVRFGDHIANVPGEAFQAVSTHRLAVVVKEKHLAAENAEAASGGLFGRAKAAVSQVQRVAEGVSSAFSDDIPVSYIEVPLSRVAGLHEVRLGRSLPRSRFARADFTDGSVLFSRIAGADEWKGTISR